MFRDIPATVATAALRGYWQPWEFLQVRKSVWAHPRNFVAFHVFKVYNQKLAESCCRARHGEVGRSRGEENWVRKGNGKERKGKTHCQRLRAELPHPRIVRAARESIAVAALDPRGSFRWTKLSRRGTAGCLQDEAKWSAACGEPTQGLCISSSGTLPNRLQPRD